MKELFECPECGDDYPDVTESGWCKDCQDDFEEMAARVEAKIENELSGERERWLWEKEMEDENQNTRA